MEPHIITGATRLVGIIGKPVTHSLSPVIHNHLFNKMDLPYAYVPLGVAAHDLHSLLFTLRAGPFIGANVTVPYKQAVIPFCDAISESAQLCGTVNTLYFNNGLLHGTTTDAQGFFTSLQRIDHVITDDHVVILGNGGTARTLGMTLSAEKKIRTLTLIGRDRARIDCLARAIREKTGVSVHTALFGSADGNNALAQCTLLINCTTVGMAPNVNASPLPKEALHPAMTVFDAIYNPAETRLLSDAKSVGCKTENGLRMLLYQGLASFYYWTGMAPDEKLIDLDDLRQFIKQA
jgi:shikimate dehydrogenase